MSERIGCGDNSCVFSVLREAGGMGTNGGCRCFKNLESWLDAEQRWNRAEVRSVELDTRRLAQALREARYEVRRLRESVATIDALYCGMGDNLRDCEAEIESLRAELESRDEGLVEVAAACRAVAERQREACVESMLRSVDRCGCLPCREQAVRATPLVTEEKP